MTGFDKTDTQNKVIDIIAEKLHAQKENIVLSSTLENLGADSLDMVEIIMRLEEQFSVEINDEDAEKLTNVAEVVDYIHRLRTK